MSIIPPLNAGADDCIRGVAGDESGDADSTLAGSKERQLAGQRRQRQLQQGLMRELSSALQTARFNEATAQWRLEEANAALSAAEARRNAAASAEAEATALLLDTIKKIQEREASLKRSVKLLFDDSLSPNRNSTTGAPIVDTALELEMSPRYKLVLGGALDGLRLLRSRIATNTEPKLLTLPNRLALIGAKWLPLIQPPRFLRPGDVVVVAKDDEDSQSGGAALPSFFGLQGTVLRVLPWSVVDEAVSSNETGLLQLLDNTESSSSTIPPPGTGCVIVRVGESTRVLGTANALREGDAYSLLGEPAGILCLNYSQLAVWSSWDDHTDNDSQHSRKDGSWSQDASPHPRWSEIADAATGGPQSYFEDILAPSSQSPMKRSGSGGGEEEVTSAPKRSTKAEKAVLRRSKKRNA